MSPLGQRQIHKLFLLSNPALVQVVPCAVTRSLAKRGLVAPRSKRSDGFVGITPAGLRASADALEAGLFQPFFDENFTTRRKGRR